MAKYEVRVNGATVWSQKIDSSSIRAFPPEYLRRPESGEVELLIDGVIVGTQRTREADDAAVLVQREEQRLARIAEARAVLIAEGVL